MPTRISLEKKSLGNLLLTYSIYNIEYVHFWAPILIQVILHAARIRGTHVIALRSDRQKSAKEGDKHQIIHKSARSSIHRRNWNYRRIIRPERQSQDKNHG